MLFLRKFCLAAGIVLLIISALSYSARAYTINEPLHEHEFNKWRLNITFGSVGERNAIWTKINSERVPNIKDFSYQNIGGLTYVVTASLKDYSVRNNKMCGNCSIWYLNGSWETIEVYDIQNSCLNCVVNYTGKYNNSDRWINLSTYTDLPHWNESNTVVWVNLTGNESQIGKAVNSSNSYSSASNGTNTFLFYDDFNRADGALGNGWATISGSALISGNRALLADTSVDGAVYNPATGAVNSIVLASDFQLISASEPYGGVLLRSTGAGNWINYGYGWVIYNNANLYVYDGGSQVTSAVPFVFTLDTWYNQEIRVASDNSMEVRIWQKGTSRPSSATISKSAFTPSASDGTGIRMIGAGNINVNHAYFDDFRVRKYVSPEPVVVYNSSLTFLGPGSFVLSGTVKNQLGLPVSALIYETGNVSNYTMSSAMTGSYSIGPYLNQSTHNFTVVSYGYSNYTFIKFFNNSNAVNITLLYDGVSKKNYEVDNIQVEELLFLFLVFGLVAWMRSKK
ncbi:MAG: hypothetical protein PHV30_09110 [Candidatus Margulisbacteria bacterium]|nr:hypothetical protein [Candidatus Margulisiibacteriota bacterium]